MAISPLVSVIITTYKRSDTLSRAVDSVLNQSYDNVEVLVIDDNQADTAYREDTARLMAQYDKYPKVHYIPHGVNKGGPAARNTGLKHAAGKYVTYLDDDDTYRVDKVKEQADFLEANPNYHAVYCGWNKDGKAEAPNVMGDLTFELLSGELLIRTNTIMMVTDTALAIGGWDESYRRNQEVGYLVKYFRAGQIMGAVPKVLIDFDSSDRSNESKPKQYEEDFMFLLDRNKETIERAAEKANRDKKIIYSLRHQNVFLRYLKNKDIKNAGKIYFNRIKVMPVRFNIDLVKYTYNKLTGKI